MREFFFAEICNFGDFASVGPAVGFWLGSRI